MKIFKILTFAFYPNKCISCGEIIDEEKSLCDYCHTHIERNNLDDFCLVCGCEKQSCICNFNIFRFDKLVTVFKNEGIAQKAYYKYKFNKRQHYARFFAQEMSAAVEKVYVDISFDYICAVPSGRSFFNSNHFDHCRYIAELMSKKLNIPFLNDVLYCSRHKKLQHKSTIQERLVNVNNKYNFAFRIDGKNILLVDDIRTTGATLDECTKMLLYAGADNVCCVAALTRKINSKKENLKNYL